MCGVFGWEHEGKTEGMELGRVVKMLSELTSTTPQGTELMDVHKDNVGNQHGVI